jgi:hypothetical protein
MTPCHLCTTRATKTGNLYNLCCATRASLDNGTPAKLRPAQASRLGRSFNHDPDDMATMAGELRHIWANQ